MLSLASKIRGASSVVACTMAFRFPPAKKVCLALVMTTPTTSSCSSYSRSTAAAIDSTYSSFMVFALAVGSSRVKVTMPSASRS